MSKNISKVILLLTLFFTMLAGCSSGSDTPDGDIEDGDIENSDGEDGETLEIEQADEDNTDADYDGDLDIESAEENDLGDSDIEMELEEESTGFEPLDALAGCDAVQPACGEEEVDSQIYASYRKDYYLPSEQYAEPLDDPLDGGRFHISAISQVSGTVTGVFVNDTPVGQLLEVLSMDWQHVWPEQVETGKPVWFAFHSRLAAWDSAATGTIRIETDNGTAVDGVFNVQIHPLDIGYVTVNDDRDTLLIHVTNTGDKALTVERVLYNGINLMGEDAVCIPSVTLNPGEHALWSAPLCDAPEMGSAWTLAIETDGFLPTTAVGRHLKPFFPIEAWPKTSDCPLPGSNDEAFQKVTEAGIDTLYTYWNGGGRCEYDNSTMYNETLPELGDTYVLLGDDFPFDDPPTDILTDTSAIAGVLTGDESDWSYTTDDGGPKPENKATRARKVWRAFPELLAYNGAMTNKHVGAFAGMTDVQGIDIYAAGCAPHILNFGNHPPLRAPFDYLRNTRNNHMPWPTWLYSQGLGGWPVNPDRQEIMIQGFEVMAAGGKGLMWFQSGMELAAQFSDTWQAMSDVNWMIRGVRHLLREGDVANLVTSDEDTIAEAIRSPDALVVPVITLAADYAPTDEDCVLYSFGQLEEEPHWKLTERTIDITVRIPEDLAVNDLFEVFPDTVSDISYTIDMDGRNILLKNIPVSNDVPVHLFVFAAGAELRGQVAELLKTSN